MPSSLLTTFCFIIFSLSIAYGQPSHFYLAPGTGLIFESYKVTGNPINISNPYGFTYGLELGHFDDSKWAYSISILRRSSGIFLDEGQWDSPLTSQNPYNISVNVDRYFQMGNISTFHVGLGYIYSYDPTGGAYRMERIISMQNDTISMFYTNQKNYHLLNIRSGVNLKMTKKIALFTSVNFTAPLLAKPQYSIRIEERANNETNVSKINKRNIDLYINFGLKIILFGKYNQSVLVD